MKIAIIGAGVSGLTAARLLDRRHEVVVYEADSRPGGHANTVDIQIDDERHAVDTGFMVFNDRTYPHFVALLNELRVPSLPTTMSFSVRCDRTGLEYNGSSLKGLFSQRRNLFRPSFWRMLRDILSFNREAPRGLSPGSSRDQDDDNVTVGEFLRRGRYSREFSEHYLLPMGSAIWSCPTGAFEKFPIRFVVEFYRNHGLLSLRDRPQWRVIDGGSRRYVEAIVRGLRGRLLLSARVESVRRLADGVEIVARGSVDRYDHVVFACHSDQALRMLADPSPVERELLSAFRYETSVALLHVGDGLLPKKLRARACWNYRLTGDPSAGASVTYSLNRLQHIRSRHEINVTLNGEHLVNADDVLARFDYAHPVFSAGRAAAQARHGELIDAQRTSYCGAYWRNGFHEDGVASALAVCQALDWSGRNADRPLSHAGAAWSIAS